MLIQAQSAAAAIQTGSTGLLSFRALARNLDERRAAFVKEPLIAREIDYAREKLADLRSADELVDDQRLFEFVLHAYDIEGQENAQALMRKVIGEDLSDPRSAANRLNDDRYRRMAGELGFAGGGGDTKLMSKLVDGYLRTTYEMRTGDELPDVTTPTQDDALQALAREPEIAAAIAAAKARLGQVSSTEAAAADPALLAFASRAAGFKQTVSLPTDMIERLIDEEDFRSKLGDERYEAFASFFQPASQGRAVADPGAAAVGELIDLWMRASFTLETGRQATGELSSSTKADIEAFAKRADIVEATERFRSDMADVANPADLLAKPKAYNFVLRLASTASQRNTDLVLAAMIEPPGSRTSPAAYEPGFAALAKSLSYLSGGGRLSDEAFVDDLVGRYVNNQFERAVGAVDLGSRYALYATRRLPDITSPFQIMGDQALRQIVLPAVGLPASSAMDVDRLAKLVEGRVEMDRLDDPDYIAELTRRYFASAATASATASVSSASLALSMLTGASQSGMGLGLLLQIQSAR